ncbi:DNA-binding protein [Halorubellus sp. JP-L1]|uniref:helix-turn-helix domain-containing protein n=1 Tax=Halorubellus sp. JP-L1 TaxID=2715753 RepID=UPI00140E33CE|nr:helix-turn-helix domain-containing protein [Halorubellus sp. JP-L1]NHN43008.1 DNA-binding protein [Halorubellus sp. JP-L1]
MSTIVDASMDAEEFALHATLSEYPSARFEVARAIATGGDEVIPFVWASGAPVDEIEAAMRADSSTKSVELVSRFDEEDLFQVSWTARVRTPFEALLGEDGAALLDASTKGTEWCFRLVYPGDVSTDAVGVECEELGVDLDVDRVYSLSDAFTRDHFELTEKQYETILAAYEAGYYDIPRKINLKELACELDVSHQALSERLRRGHEVLMTNSLGMEFEGSLAGAGGPDGGVSGPPLAGSREE